MNSVTNNLVKSSPWKLNFLELAAFFLLAIIGIYAALNAGISWDEEAEYKTYLTNLAVFQGLLKGDLGPYADLAVYYDRYYGVGFHLLSHGLGSFLYSLKPDLFIYSTLGSRLIWAHLGTFLAFLASSIFFRACLLVLTKDRLIASLGMFAFLLWPYLFGHALMNVKDVPFLFIWLLCTYLALNIFIYARGDMRSPWCGFAVLGLVTGWLISIRVSGVLIFIEYFWLMIFWYVFNRPTKFKFSVVQFALSFLLALCLGVYLLYPILWLNPFEFSKALAYMSSHPWLGNTLTAGQLIESKTRLPFYILSWLSVKLPIVVIVGLCLLPFVFLSKTFRNEKSVQYWAVAALGISVLSILSLLVIKRVGLYNELRQILFMAPLLMMLAIVALKWFNRKLAIVALVASTALMAIDDITLNPYQYTYVNELARHTELGKKYETDYFGLSVSQTARWLNESNVDGSSQCLYVPSVHLWNYEMNPQKFPCVGNYPGDLSLLKKPFLFFVQSRSVSSFAPPKWCQLLHLESRKLPYSSAVLKHGELYGCSPP